MVAKIKTALRVKAPGFLDWPACGYQIGRPDDFARLARNSAVKNCYYDFFIGGLVLRARLLFF